MKTAGLVSLLALLLAAPAARAAPQEDPAPAVSAAAQERFDALEEEASDAMSAFYAEYRKAAREAQAAGKPRPRMESPIGEFVPRFKKAAEEYAGSEDCVPFHVWIVQNSQADAKASLTTLCDKHVASPRLAPLAMMLPQLERVVGKAGAKELLAKLEKESSVPDVRGWASFALHSATLTTADPGSDEFRKAKATLMAVAETAGEGRLADQIKSKIRIAEQFGNGAVAPDIVGIDIDGTAFKLSDYKGKVIFLDFWGDW